MKMFLSKCAFNCILVPSLLTGFEAENHESPEPLSSLTTAEELLLPKAKDNIVVASKQIHIPGCPMAFNPSIVRVNQRILLIFRHVPNVVQTPFISETGALWLDDDLQPATAPQLLITRKPGDPTPQQSEDARVFLWNGEPYLIYNDNIEITNASDRQHRDMFIAKLNYDNERFSLGEPKKIIHCDNYEKVYWQKNWQPFDWNGELMLSYTINPHEVLSPDLETGVCYPVYKTKGDITWHWGKLRGGALAQLVDGQYLGFFHSPIQLVSETTQGRFLMHYFMGAYTFSAEPPFNVTGISPYPIVAEGYYTPSPMGIRCVYPGGFVYDESNIYLAYGKDDREVWISTIDKEKLYRSLQPVQEVDSETQGLNEGH